MAIRACLASPAPRHISPGQIPAKDVVAPEIAFLTCLVEQGVLVAATQVARREGVCAARALIMYGGVSASFFYRALARRLGLSFDDRWPELEMGFDVGDALAAGRVRLAGHEPARWLIAPQGDQLRALLARRLKYFDPRQFAITTPAHFAAVVHFRAQTSIESIATERLSAVAPRASAKGAVDACAWSVLGLLAAYVLSGLLIAACAIGDMFGLIFLGGMVLRLIAGAAAIVPPDEPAPILADAELPQYTVLVPLHREAEVVPDIIDALAAIDYPRTKLEVLVLIEPQDHATRAALASASLPPWMQIVFAPRLGELRTKPRALNIGLLMASGEFLTVYDAEDRPDPDQLRRAAAIFKGDRGLSCLQARLSIDNGDRSILARMFAIEYAGLFDVLNVGIARLGLPLALGGTSNHFRCAALREAGGWDAWNVTEDADLGLRLARLGFRVGCLDSKTSEAAPETLAVWMKQRRRWMKGWMQTLVVLVRDAFSVSRGLGWGGSVAAALLLANMVIGPLGLPVFVGFVVYNLAEYGIPAPQTTARLLEATLSGSVLLMGIASTLWCAVAGMRARGLMRFLPSLPLFFPYQLMISVAALWAFFDLVAQPHHWHKTPHARRVPTARTDPSA